MLDTRALRQELNATAGLLKRRGFELNTNLIQKLENQRKQLQMEVQDLQQTRNQRSKEVGRSQSKEELLAAQLALMEEIKEQLTSKEAILDETLEQLHAIYAAIPNTPHSSVPDGLDESQNHEIRRWGKIRDFDFVPKSHEELGDQLAMMNFKEAAKITGTRFVVLRNKIAKLHRALTQFMLDVHTREHGYQELYVPHLVNTDSLFGTGQLPKFKDDQFNIEGDFKYSLISTAEIPVTNLVRGEILSEEQLPLKYVAHTPCYRSEVGSYGKDLHGMIRQHQFEKVELVRIEKSENSYQAHEELTQHAEKILQKLELPYRVVSLCCGDLGFCSAKTYDLEVWLPQQDRYREISSCSNFEAFQARRMQARYRLPNGNTELLHTLNGSGLAVGRTLIAIMENYQNADGSITIPEALHNYMGNEKVINKI